MRRKHKDAKALLALLRAEDEAGAVKPGTAQRIVLYLEATESRLGCQAQPGLQ
jgi:hypothetical protein